MTTDAASSGTRVERRALGATVHPGGTHFAVFSHVAEGMTLCLFDDDHRSERHEMQRGDDGVWRAEVEGVGHGRGYSFQVSGEFDPGRGLWCEEDVHLLDPYARSLDGVNRALGSSGYLGNRPSKQSPEVRERELLSVVVDDAFDWGDDAAVRPRRSLDETVIYELHVRGATMRHPAVPAPLRGTYAGLAHGAVLSHLVDLGATAVELLPVHEYVDETFLADDGLSNYWGYNSIGYFAPTNRYSSAAAEGRVGGVVAEFKEMVKALHLAGLEVILDVVYNHTAEGDEHGPRLSFRGLDASTYYLMDEDGHFVDTTGCGNSWNATSPVAIDLVLDSLRYWVTECHVDGFRFDLAPTLARVDGRFDPAAPILRACTEDPLLRDVKLICEPWDVGRDDSFALGEFPAPFAEWNGKYRDCVRDFWRGEDGTLAELATRMAGSTDLFVPPERSSAASINFVTCHDGFTLADLVAYEEKHNEANGQDNADGTDDNRSWNCGAEGDTDDRDVLALRDRQARALLATLLLSRGVPMLLAGDELGRTQGGNNNAYCQDNETSWLDWDAVDHARLAFTTRLLALRRQHAGLRRTGEDPASIRWLRPDGTAMEARDWQEPSSRSVMMRSVDDDGSDVFVLVNGHHEAVWCSLPDDVSRDLSVVLSTYDPSQGTVDVAPGGLVEVQSRSIVVVARDGAS